MKFLQTTESVSVEEMYTGFKKILIQSLFTKSTAKTLFGDEDPIGKMVRFDNKNDLKVTGVLENLPGNSTFKFNYLVPFSYYEQTSNYVKQVRNGS